MTEEVHVQGPARTAANLRDRCVGLLEGQARTRERAERAGATRGDGERDGAETGHRREQDRELDPEQVERAAIGPGGHGFSSASGGIATSARHFALTNPTTSTAMAPPTTIAGTVPTSDAARPLSKPPSSFDMPMKT